jgi:putative nucleotidyltransferase with HDIG domain
MQCEAVAEQLLNSLQNKHSYSYQHCLAVERYAWILALQISPAWTWENGAALKLGARLHDIGKLRIDNAILDGTGKLTDEEFAQIKTHPRSGVEILMETGVDFPEVVYEPILCHHMAFDRKAVGYPIDFWGEDIPLAARIVAVADIFDALTTKRSYKPALSFGESAGILLAEAGKKLDPFLVQVFVHETIPYMLWNQESADS